MTNQSPFAATFQSLLFTVLASPVVFGGCFSECCPEHRAEESDAMVLAQVTDLRVWAENETNFVTTATLSVGEELMGREIPANLEVSFPGGTLEGITHYDSFHVDLEEGGHYLLYLKEEEDHWTIYQASAMEVQLENLALQKAAFLGEEIKARKNHGGEKSNSCEGETIPSSRETPSGYFESSGVPGRLRRCDSGQPLLVEIDSEVLPGGMTQAEALAAVRSALDAWEAASGLTFLISANYDFGQTVRDMDGGESTIHIQLHDLYNEISSTSTLGRAGGSTSSSSGGIVNGVSFRRSLHRYVVMNHESSSNENVVTFTEVLTHEIGHALGLTHSSEDINEAEPLLAEATMYYRVHKDGRGAVTNCYDEDRIQYAYPESLPPVAFERKLRAVSRPSSQPVSPANRIVLEGFSSNGAALTYSFPDGLNTSLGSWAWDSGSRTLTFDPGSHFGDTIASGFNFFTRLNYEVSDGTNSGAASIRVIAIRRDDNGQEPDIGVNNPLPEAWLEDTFGNANIHNNPTNPLYQADADFDGDGIDNLKEFQMGTDAADAASGPVSLNFASDYSWFEVEGAPEASLIRYEVGSDLENWDVLSFLEAEAGSNRIYLVPPSGEKVFFRAIYRH